MFEKGEIIMTELYSDNTFSIYHTNDGYLLHNRSIPGFAHTHLRNYNTALKLIELQKKEKCPLDLPHYLVISLFRITEEGKYRDRIEQVMDMKKRDGYRNSRVSIACRA